MLAELTAGAAIAETASKIWAKLNTQRTVLVELANRTPFILRVADDHHDHGGFAEPPDFEVPPNTASLFGSQSKSGSIMTGTEGWVWYTVGDGLAKFRVYWNNPFVGDNDCGTKLDGLHHYAFGKNHILGAGNNAHMKYEIRMNPIPIVTSDPTASSWGPGNIDVFCRGGNKALWHAWWDGSNWHGFEDLGGVIPAWERTGLPSGVPPAAVARQTNWVDVFALGMDKGLYVKWWDGQKWSEWVDLGGVLTSPPAASSWGPNNIDVFGLGKDKSLWHLWWDGQKWSAWEDLGGKLTSAPAAVGRQHNWVDVFYRGQNNHLWTRWWDGQKWSGEVDLGGVLTSAPTASSWGPNNIDVFYRGQNNALWHRWWDGQKWSGEEDLGGTLASAPAAVARQPNYVHVFAVGMDRTLYTKGWYGQAWSDWIRVGLKWPFMR